MLTAKSEVRPLTITAMTLGVRLRQARTRLNPKVGQEDVAKAAGLTRSRISQIESGGSELMAEPAIRIADALKVNVRWLVMGEGPMEGESPPPQAPEGLSDMAIVVAKRWDSLESLAQTRILELLEYLQLITNPRYWSWSEKQRKAAFARAHTKAAKGES